jgi:hypothetical protein
MSSYTLIYAISAIVWFVAAGAVAKRGDWKEEIGFGIGTIAGILLLILFRLSH